MLSQNRVYIAPSDVEDDLRLADHLALYFPSGLHDLIHRVLLACALHFFHYFHVVSVDLVSDVGLDGLDLELLEGIEEEAGGVFEAFSEVDGVGVVLVALDLVEVIAKRDEAAGEGVDGC